MKKREGTDREWGAGGGGGGVVVVAAAVVVVEDDAITIIIIVHLSTNILQAHSWNCNFPSFIGMPCHALLPV